MRKRVKPRRAWLEDATSLVRKKMNIIEPTCHNMNFGIQELICIGIEKNMKNMLKSWKKTLEKKKMYKINQEKLIEHINNKWRNKGCQCCGYNNWTVGDNIVTTLSVGNNRDIQIGEKLLPLVAVTCNHCGNTVFINALVANAIDSDSEG